MHTRKCLMPLAIAIAFLLPTAVCLCDDNVGFENDRMYVDGEPFFYWGFIWRPTPITLQMLADHGFNAVKTARRPSPRKEYKTAQKLGIHLMDSSTADWISEHPAFLAWFLLDDASGKKDLKRVKKRVKARRKIDKTHPTIVDLNSRTVEGDLPFVDVIDIYAPYAYPLPTKGYDWYFYDFLDKLRRGVGRKYVWSAFQCSGIYSKHARLGFNAEDMHKFPTPGQFRLLCWGGIAHGVRGFMFWPMKGLLPAEADNGDRTAEAMIISKELDVLGADIIEGDEVRDGASGDRDDIDIGRIDLPTHTILIASVVRDGYEYAMDRGTATTTIRLEQPHQLQGELQAYSVSFGGLKDLPLKQRENELVLPDVAIDVTRVIIIQTEDGPKQKYREGFVRHRQQAAKNSQMLLRYLHGKMSHLHNSLQALRVDVPQAEKQFEKAVEFKETSADKFQDGDFADTYNLARRAQRHYRQCLFEYRAYADSLRDDAPPRAGKYLMMPYTLPRFFASFDHTAPGND